MSEDPSLEAVNQLVRASRASRKAMHMLIDRVRIDQYVWRHDLAQLVAHPRLTASQRRRLRTLEQTARRR